MRPVRPLGAIDSSVPGGSTRWGTPEIAGAWGYSVPGLGSGGEGAAVGRSGRPGMVLVEW